MFLFKMELQSFSCELVLVVVGRLKEIGAYIQMEKTG